MAGLHRSLSSLFHHERQYAPVVLAFCACFVDVICLIGLFQTFSAFITGTLVVLFVEVFHRADHVSLKVFVLCVFFLSTFCMYRVLTVLLRNGHMPVGYLFAFEAFLLAVFMLVAGVLDPRGLGPSHPVTFVAIGFATAAMAVQNMIMLTMLKRHVPTTFMTGNTLRLVIGLADYFDHPEAREEARHRIRHQVQVISAFAAGGLLASFLMAVIGFWSLIVPVTVLIVLAFSQDDPAPPATA